MKKNLVLFPNITIGQPCTLWGIRFTGRQPHLSQALAGSRVLAELEYRDDNEEKAVMRQLEVLRCHLMLASYLAGRNPRRDCKMIILSREEEEPADAYAEKTVPLNLLADYMPNELEDSARTVCWFAHYMEQPLEDERARVFRLYNALGTLPGGFDGISSISSSKDDKAALAMLLDRVEDFHAQDEEDENYVPKTRPLDEEEIRTVEACYIKCLQKFYQ